jgi:hypothetical protein
VSTKLGQDHTGNGHQHVPDERQYLGADQLDALLSVGS